MAKIALINFYARLIRNGQMKEEEIPPEHHDAVMEAYKKLPPLPDDSSHSASE